MRLRLARFSFAAPGVLAAAVLAPPASAQIATDGTVGPRLGLAGPNYEIGAELGSLAGGNLFHSFERFSLASSESATFSGPDDVRNVISRVTGGARSDIDGMLRSTIPGADFFFVNPAGVVFGPNASLDVQGSFHVSTADELRFSNGAVFSAVDPSASSLTVAAPQAFGFLGAQPAGITVNGSGLQVPGGETLSLVGGDISVRGGGAIHAESGTVNLLSLGPNSDADIVAGGPTEGRGEINLMQGAAVDTSGDGGGSVGARAGRFLLSNSIITASNTGPMPAERPIDISADEVILHSSLIIHHAEDSGNAGTVRIRAGEVELLNDAAIGAASFAQGDAGSIIVTSDDEITISGAGGGLFVNSLNIQENSGDAGTIDLTGAKVELNEANLESVTLGGGSAGTIIVEAQTIDLGKTAAVSAESFLSGAGGIVEIEASSLTADNAFIGARPAGSGAGGAVTISADHILLTDEGRVFNGTDGAGDGGRIAITAHSLVIDGATDHPARFGTGVSASTNEGSSGQGGDVEVTAHRILLINGGEISSVTRGDGAGGDVVIHAREILAMSNEGVISTEAFGDGPAGDVAIDAFLLRLDNSFIGANSREDAGEGGDAGSVTISADRIELVNDGRIFNGTNGAGDGGDIEVTAGTIFADVGSDPTTFHTGIASTAERDSTGASGNITVHADEIRLINGGVITTSTFAQGDAGRIEIKVADLHISSESLDSESTIASVTRGDGKGGIVDIEAHDISIDFGFIGANTFGANEQADAGSVIIHADTLHFINEGRIFNGTNGGGDGGDVHVTARTIIADATVDHVSQFHTGIASTAEAGSTGASGDVTVRAEEIRLIHGGLIATSSQGFGNAGNVIVAAGETLEIRGHGADRPSSISVSSENSSTRAAVGNLEIEAAAVEISDGGRIEATNAGLGRSGGVTLRAHTLRLKNGAAITAGSGQVDAGDIAIEVEDLVDLQRSSITTSAADGEGGGGNILIDPRFVVLDRSEIVASARRGAGGSIVVIADNFIRSPDSVLDASSDLGLPGTVSVSSPEVDLTGGLVALDVPLLDAAAQLRERCAARRDVGASSLTGVGRGGLPPGPDQPLMSDYTTAAAPRAGSARSGDAAVAVARAPVLLVQPCTGAL